MFSKTILNRLAWSHCGFLLDLHLSYANWPLIEENEDFDNFLWIILMTFSSSSAEWIYTCKKKKKKKKLIMQ